MHFNHVSRNVSRLTFFMICMNYVFFLISYNSLVFDGFSNSVMIEYM